MHALRSVSSTWLALACAASLLVVSQGRAQPVSSAAADATAEKPQGTVRGTVTATEDGTAVSGARVYVRGAPVEAETAMDGRFSLNLFEGTYQLSVIHPSFSTQSVPSLQVRGGEARELTVALSPASAQSDEFVISAARIEGGVASLLEERRESSAVADVIGSEQMARSGDSSAASALARVTGLTVVDGKYVIVRGMGERYSNMTLNGMQVPSPDPTRRVVPLDLFPTGVLEGVVVQKSYSPDMPGEFGGGIVQLRSRSYPDELLWSVTLQGGYNTQTHLRKNLASAEHGSFDALGFDDGTRALPDEIADTGGKIVKRSRFDPPGVNYSAEEIDAFGNSLPNNYRVKKEFTPVDYGLVATVGNKFHLDVAKLGFVASVGYRDRFTAVRDQAVRTVFVQAGDLAVKDDLTLDVFQKQVSLSGFLDWGVEFSKHQQLRFTTMLLRQTDDSSTQRTGYLETLSVDTKQTRLMWVERQILLQQASGQHRFSRRGDFQVDWRYAYARANRYEPDRRDYLYQNTEGTSEYLISPTSGGNQRLFGDLDDVTHEAGLDLTQPFDVWKRLTAKAKIGGLVYVRNRTAEARRFEYNLGPELNAQTRALSPEALFTEDNIGNGLTFTETTLANDNYDAAMRIQAGYAMVELPLHESLDVTAGARVERATIEVTTYDQFNPDAPPALAKLDDVDPLPAATLTFRFVENLQLRGGYSRTLNRPDLRELSPSRYNDVETNALYIGNENLKRTTIDNYDARLEWYYTTDEVFSVGGFYKHFTNPIESTIAAGAETIFSLDNTNSARVVGLELEGRKRFDFIDPVLDRLYVASNVSLIDSEVDLGEATRALQAQSPWVFNAQLGWDDTDEGGTGTAASVLYNLAGRRIRAVGDPDQNLPDQYEEPFHRLDLVVTQNLPNDLKMGLKVQNMLNPVQRWKQGDIVVRSFRRGTEFSLNAAWSY